MNLADWLRDAATRLAAVSDTPRLDAELLAAHALGMERAQMILRLRDLALPAAAEALIERRLAHEPVAHIIGTRDFWTLTLKVTPATLIPRPDSETLIEAAIDHFRDRAPPARILDLGTGSGALLLAALDEWRSATGLGIDASEAALAIAQENARDNGMADRAAFRPGDWCAGIDERFDLILCNPPYIRSDAMLPREVAGHEPATALFAGPDGLDAYRLLAPQIAARLAPGGCAAVEIGLDQAERAGALFAAAGLTISVRADLAGRARCLALTCPQQQQAKQLF